MRAFAVLVALGHATLIAACAHSPRASPVEVAIEKAIIRDSGGEARGEVAAYAAFINHGTETLIVDAWCECSDTLELHVMVGEGADRRMTNVWPLVLPAGSRTEIVPGSPRHMMAVGITEPIAVGETHRIRFQLADGSWIAADFVAVPNSADAWRAFEVQTAN